VGTTGVSTTTGVVTVTGVVGTTGVSTTTGVVTVTGVVGTTGVSTTTGVVTVPGIVGTTGVSTTTGTSTVIGGGGEILVVSNDVGRLTPLAAPTGTEPAKLGIIRHVLKTYPMPESITNKTTGFMATNLQSYHS
jgi:hypothetical protein